MAYAFITGSSSGIGRATAIALAQAGWNLGLHANRNLRGLAETVEAISGSSDRQIKCFTADVSCPVACRSLVAAAFAGVETPTAWINLAGADVLTGPAAAWDFDDKLVRLLAVDLLGTVRLSRLVADRWRQAFSSTSKSERTSPTTAALPSLVNIGWDQATLGMEGPPGQMFGTTKAAVQAFSQALAISEGPNIRVNCVAPGWIQTAWGETSAKDNWVQRAKSESLLNRWGRAGDVAAAIAWLVSAEAEFVNGQTLNVNGGRRFFTQ